MPIERNLAGSGKIGWSHGDQQAYAPSRNQQTKRATGSSYQEACGHQFTRQLSSRSSQRGADCKVLLPCSRTDQHHVGEIGAASEDHNADRSEQCPQQHSVAADNLIAQRQNARRRMFGVIDWVLLFETIRDCGEFVLNLFRRDPWFQEREGAQEIRTSIRSLWVRFKYQR